MVLQNGEYKIENKGIWDKKEVLEEFRDHYYDVADFRKLLNVKTAF